VAVLGGADAQPLFDRGVKVADRDAAHARWFLLRAIISKLMARLHPPGLSRTASSGPRGARGTLVRVSDLALHMEGHLAELDINPLMVLPSGQGVKAVDALVVFRGT
jgi:acetate---CoA ligase (ADP-forming)